MKSKCDCILPFYNEGLKPIDVVEALLKVKSISKIIAIDDGSDDDSTYLKIKTKFPQVTSIRLKTNAGKSNAVKESLKQVKAEYIFLIDGDLTNIKLNEIEDAIQKIINNDSTDMIILRRIEDKTVIVSRYIRHDVIFSGQRILRKSDLKNIFINKISDYQVEMAINTYMMKNKKIVYWMQSSVHNSTKWTKWGWIKGTKRSFNMFKGFVNYAGWRNFIWQTLFFCRNEAP